MENLRKPKTVRKANKFKLREQTFPEIVDWKKHERLGSELVRGARKEEQN